MKKFLLSIGIMIASFAAFSQTSCPTQFFRNNGNSGGCGSHIKLYFATCPTSIPTLDSIKINGVLQPETFTILGKVCTGGNPYIDYCIGNGNLPPASNITVFLTYPGGATGGTSGSVICNVPSSGSLPVILSGFEAKRNSDNSVSATWQTQQEINSSSFEIERAYDNNNFEKIGRIQAAGNSSSSKTYTFSDNSNINKGVSFYRIKMIDKDGAFTYTETKTVKGSSAKFDFAIFPNPSHGSTNVTINGLNEPTEVQLLDVSGRLVKSLTLNNTSTTQLNNLEKGSYFVRVTGKVTGVTSVKKLSVIN
jgi:hypothetical protein